jgi:hypothetical protein
MCSPFFLLGALRLTGKFHYSQDFIPDLYEIVDFVYPDFTSNTCLFYLPLDAQDQISDFSNIRIEESLEGQFYLSVRMFRSANV